MIIFSHFSFLKGGIANRLTTWPQIQGSEVGQWGLGWLGVADLNLQPQGQLSWQGCCSDVSICRLRNHFKGSW